MQKLFFLSLLTLILLFAAQTGGLKAFDNGTHSALGQTIPTRTPTPLPAPPTATPAPASPTANPGNPPPGATQPSEATQIPGATDTATAVPLPATPAGGFLATAVPCSNQPTIMAYNAINLTNVRQGPGQAFPTFAQLLTNEVRPIMGRAAEAPWWLIQLSNGQMGWVADQVVTVQGNTRNVPLVAAPPIGAATVTPGAPWQPTPPPQCPTPVPTLAAATSEPLVVAPLETSTNEASYPAATPEETGETAVKELTAVTPTPSPTAIVLPTSVAAVPEPTTTAPIGEPITESEPFDPSGLLLVGAALMVVMGTAVFIIKRR